MQPELILKARAELAEGPVWDARAGRLYWVDIHAGHLHVYNPASGNDLRLDLGAPVGCVAPARGGGLVAALKGGLVAVDLACGELELLADPEPDKPGNRFNDGKCDPAGRFLAGSMDDAEQDASGALYSLAPDRSLRTLLTGLRISNGLGWSPDGATFYHIDTPTRTVSAYDYDLATGALAHPRPAVTVPPELGWPDGMAVDAEGMLWVALWGGGAVARFDPSGGRLLAKVDLPALHVTCPTFGGAGLDELYVTTARIGLSPAQLAAAPASGGLFRLHPGVHGLPAFEFAG